MSQVVNIGPRERAKRRNVGIVMLLVAAAAAAWMISTHQPPIWRLALVAPIGMGVLGLLQAAGST